MYTFVLIVHILTCVLLMTVVLLQAGKGADAGAAFGGSSQTIFGSRGAGTFLSRATIGVATLFMITSLSLSILNKGRLASSVINLPKPPPVSEEKKAEEKEAEPAGVSSSKEAVPTTTTVGEKPLTPPTLQVIPTSTETGISPAQSPPSVKVIPSTPVAPNPPSPVTTGK